MIFPRPGKHTHPRLPDPPPASRVEIRCALAGCEWTTRIRYLASAGRVIDRHIAEVHHR